MDWKQEHPQYNFSSLHDEHIPSSPWILWKQWLEEASHILTYTNEIALATADLQGNVSVRMVLLKYYSEEKGFCWYTNRNSEKGTQLHNNPQASLLWYVKEQHRQVRICGAVKEFSRDDVIAYAHARPIKSQISALISKQSRPIASQQMLHKNFDTALHTYQNEESIPVSEEWTGYSLDAHKFEFWQGNSNRMHDRIVFTFDEHNPKTTKSQVWNTKPQVWNTKPQVWNKERLQP